MEVVDELGAFTIAFTMKKLQREEEAAEHGG
jgi:hypothetical protein